MPCDVGNRRALVNHLEMPVIPHPRQQRFDARHGKQQHRRRICACLGVDGVQGSRLQITLLQGHAHRRAAAEPGKGVLAAQRRKAQQRAAVAPARAEQGHYHSVADAVDPFTLDPLAAQERSRTVFARAGTRAGLHELPPASDDFLPVADRFFLVRFEDVPGIDLCPPGFHHRSQDVERCAVHAGCGPARHARQRQSRGQQHVPDHRHPPSSVVVRCRIRRHGEGAQGPAAWRASASHMLRVRPSPAPS